MDIKENEIVKRLAYIEDKLITYHDYEICYWGETTEFSHKATINYYYNRRDYILSKIEYCIDNIRNNNIYIREYRDIIKNTTNARKMRNAGNGIRDLQAFNDEYEYELKLLREFYNKYFFDGAEKFYA